jgi:hypothetical protein
LKRGREEDEPKRSEGEDDGRGFVEPKTILAEEDSSAFFPLLKILI